MIISKPIKAKRCKSCMAKFYPLSRQQIVCDDACALKYVIAVREKKARIELKVGRLAQKSRAQWAKEAKTAIQQSRRLEELAKGRGCMSCGRSRAEVMGADSWKPGGYWDGGHFMGKGAFPELALEPLNIWLQCKRCNGGSGNYARKEQTVKDGYRANLIALEGLELVEWLEGKHPPAKHTVDDLKLIKAHHNAISAKLKRL